MLPVAFTRSLSVVRHCLSLCSLRNCPSCIRFWLTSVLPSALPFFRCKVRASHALQVPGCFFLRNPNKRHGGQGQPCRTMQPLFPHKIPATFRFFFSLPFIEPIVLTDIGATLNKKRYSRILLEIPCIKALTLAPLFRSVKIFKCASAQMFHLKSFEYAREQFQHGVSNSSARGKVLLDNAQGTESIGIAILVGCR